MNNRLKYVPILLVGVLVLSIAAAPAHARRNGPPAGVSGSLASSGFNCSECHVGSTGFAGSVQILGAPSYYQQSAIYDLTVRIADASQAGAGFQMSVEDDEGNHVGSLIVTDATNTQLNSEDSGYINHTGAGVNNSVTNWDSLGDAAEYTVRWQAPSSVVGPITFWAAGNAINNDFSFFDDHVYVTSVTAGVPVPAVSEWGLMVLGLLLTTAATLIAARRSRRAVWHD